MENILFYIILIVTGVAVLLTFIFTKNKAIKKIAYDLVVFAENEFKGSKLGEDKLNFVVCELKKRFPRYTRFISTDTLRTIIEIAVKKMKNHLSSNNEDNA